MPKTTDRPNDRNTAAHQSRRTAIGQLLGAASLLTLGIGRSDADAAAPASAATLPAQLGLDLNPQQRAAGVAFLSRHLTVDTHCHPGLFILEHLPYETPTTRAFGAPFEERAIADLSAGQVSAALFAAVADMRLLELSPTSGMRAVGDYRPGEAYADYQRQLAELKSLVTNPKLAPGLTPADIGAAKRRHRTAAVFAVEGGDFIEDRLERVHEAFRDGVRAITVVHYHVNQIGDIQTEAPVHGGLTPLGKSIISEMNRAGIIVDLAHATFAMTKDVLDVSSRPVMISHTNLATAALNHPRLISTEHAKLVVAAGGVIGSWPSGIGQKTFADYIDSIQRLVDTVGIDHVTIGTDMDANYRPVFGSYRDWGLIPAALLARGLHDADVAKIMGGNFLRVFAAALAHA
jgi:membrane dipeptidase